MIKRYVVTFVIFILIDLLWLGLVAPKLYQNQIGHLMAQKVNFPAAGIFYLIYIVALLVFVIQPAMANQKVSQAILYGALLGFAMYATYDLTNLATLKDWPIKITIIDLLWGSFVTATTCGLSTKLLLHLKW